MTLRQLLLILRTRYRVALTVLVATVALTVPYIATLPRVYTASTSLVVDMRSPDPITALLLPANMATQQEVIMSEKVAQKAVKLLRLDEDPHLQQTWTGATGGRGVFELWMGRNLQGGLKVSPPRQSGIITLEYTAADPAFAAQAANAFAQAYVEAMVEMKVEPA